MDDPEKPRRRRRLSAEDKWQIFIEAPAKDAKVADVLRCWRIDSSQLARDDVAAGLSEYADAVIDADRPSHRARRGCSVVGGGFTGPWCATGCP